jgi:aromatic-L-amino-acid decarboxylase
VRREPALSLSKPPTLLSQLSLDIAATLLRSYPAGQQQCKEVEMISDDIQLAQELYRLVEAHPELQACTQGLSITTFRYVPPDLAAGSEQVEAYLNQLNAELLTRLQKSGEAVVSNAVVGGTFLLLACIVNFRTSLEDIEALPGIVIRLGKEVNADMRPAELKSA